MASFWVDPNTNVKYYEGRAFTYNDRQYTPSGATSAKFTELGFNGVTVGARPNDKFYIVSGPDNTGAYTSTPRDLDELKTYYVRSEKLKARSILSVTDWLVIRLSENTNALPAAVATFRDSVRTVSNDNCTLIYGASTVADLEALVTAPTQILQDANDPESAIANPDGLGMYPEAVDGYDY